MRFLVNKLPTNFNINRTVPKTEFIFERNFTHQNMIY